MSNFLLANRFTEIHLPFWAVILQSGFCHGTLKCQLFWISSHNESSSCWFFICVDSIFPLQFSWFAECLVTLLTIECEFLCTFSKCYTSQISWVTPWAADGFSLVWVLSWLFKCLDVEPFWWGSVLISWRKELWCWTFLVTLWAADGWFSLVWVLSCLFKVPAWEHLKSHWEQLNG